MEKNLYVIRDEVALDNSVLLMSDNEQIFKRNIKALLLDQRPNYLNQDTKDKRAFLVGKLNTNTGIIQALDTPVPVFPIEQVRLELIDEINMEKAKAYASKKKACEAAGVDIKEMEGDEDGDSR